MEIAHQMSSLMGLIYKKADCFVLTHSRNRRRYSHSSRFGLHAHTVLPIKCLSVHASFLACLLSRLMGLFSYFTT